MWLFYNCVVWFVHQRASDLHVLSRLLGAEGAKGEVVLVSPTPVDEDNKLKVSIVVKDGGELFGIFMSACIFQIVLWSSDQLRIHANVLFFKLCLRKLYSFRAQFSPKI